MSLYTRYCYIQLFTLLPCILEAAPYAGTGFYGKTEASINYSSNLSQAWIPQDVVDDTSLNLLLGGGYNYQTSDGGLLVLSSYLAYTGFKTYSDINQLNFSVGGLYLFQIEPAYSATTYQLSGRVTSLNYLDSAIRKGELLELGVGANKKLGTHWLLTIDYLYQQRFASDKTFETNNHWVSLTAEYRASQGTTLYVSYEFLQGDLLSSAEGPRDSPPSASLADERVFDPVYRDCSRSCENWTYRFTGDGYRGTVGAAIDLQRNLTFDLSIGIYNWDADVGIGDTNWSALAGIIWHF